MYNRYIPQADGSYQRNRIQEPRREPEISEPSPVLTISPPNCETERLRCSSCDHRVQNHRLQAKKNTHGNTNTDYLSFLRRLLPQNFDIEDLIVVLLLLLMAGDSQEDKNTSLLTLALYLFL